jgi:hypothetical protein
VQGSAVEALVTSGLTRRFGGRTAVNNLSLRVVEGVDHDRIVPRIPIRRGVCVTELPLDLRAGVETQRLVDPDARGRRLRQEERLS